MIYKHRPQAIDKWLFTDLLGTFLRKRRELCVSAAILVQNEDEVEVFMGNPDVKKLTVIDSRELTGSLLRLILVLDERLCV